MKLSKWLTMSLIHNMILFKEVNMLMGSHSWCCNSLHITKHKKYSHFRRINTYIQKNLVI